MGLDNGFFGQCVVLSMAVWWGMLILLAFSRRKLTQNDHTTIRLGFLLILTIMVIGQSIQLQWLS